MRGRIAGRTGLPQHAAWNAMQLPGTGKAFECHRLRRRLIDKNIALIQTFPSGVVARPGVEMYRRHVEYPLANLCARGYFARAITQTIWIASNYFGDYTLAIKVGIRAAETSQSGFSLDTGKVTRALG